MIIKEQNQKQVYSDGETVEFDMLKIAEEYPEDSSQDFIANNSNYTINNTFSSVRRNILNWYPFKENSDILEVGAGMGSLTGLLCDVAKTVTSIEMSQTRAKVIRARYPHRQNLNIISENINDWDTNQRFDYIVFIGVLEYAAIFSDSDKPFEEFLNSCKNLLKPDGTILFAIENRFGVKYWAGAAEDHLQKPFVGIEGYKEKKTAKTFSRAELNKMLDTVGLKNHRIYNVFPDYKFPTLICTDEYSPNYMNMQKVAFTYSANSSLSFNEKDIYKDLIENNTLDFFSNSFLIEAKIELLDKEHVVFVSGRGETKKKYRISTIIDSNRSIFKIPVHEQAREHIEDFLKIQEILVSRGVKVIPSELRDDKLYCEYFTGKEAQAVFEELLARNDIQGIESLIYKLKESFLKSSDITTTERTIIDEAGLANELEDDLGLILHHGFVDMTFYNSFYEQGELIFYDQEWSFDNIPLNFMLYYAIKSAYSRIKTDTKIALDSILELVGVTKNLGVYDKLESYIWSKVMYRQTDFYGNDGYCNMYSKEITTQEKFDQLSNELKDQNNINNQLTAENSKLQEEKSQLIDNKIKLEEINVKLELNCSELNSRLEQTEVELENKRGHIDQLILSERNLKSEIEMIKGTKLYKCSKLVWRTIDVMLPSNSKRRLFLKLLKKSLRHPVKSIKMLSPRKVRHFFYFLKEEGPSSVSKRIDDSMQGVAIQGMELMISEKKCKEFGELEEINFIKVNDPLVSIVIPVYNQFNYTYDCLMSIYNNSGSEISYEIIIADDCSTDDTIRLEELVHNLRIIRNETNLRFLKNCNHAASFARGKYIMFLNNDTEVQPDWLKPLVELFVKNDDIGMVGSKLIYANGKLQEAGGILWSDGSAWNYGHNCDPVEPEYNYVKEVDYISGAAIMIKTDLWKIIGGFDERFAPAYYEDTDLAFEVRKHGFRVLYQPLSVVVHFEGVSNGTDLSSGQKAYQATNQKKFYQKWKQVLTLENYKNGENVFLAKDRGRGKKTLLLVDHYVPMYDKDAGSRCIFYYLNLFTKMGYNIKFIGDNFYKHEPYTTVLQQMGIEVLYGNFYYNNYKDWINKNGKYFDYVFLSRPHISIKYIDMLKQHSNAKIIYFGHDLHFLREMREYELNGNEKALRDSIEWKKTELELMRKADISYYLSNIELDEIKKVDPLIKTRRVPINIYDEFPEINYNAAERKDIIFVGGFGHPPNVDAVKWLGEEIMPKIWEANPDIVLHVVGSKPPVEIQKFNSEKMIIHGFVSDEELERMYNNVRIAFVPLRYGAGIKGKVIEAMMRGIPMITTTIGVEGIEGAEDIIIVADQLQQLVENVVKMYSSNLELNNMSRCEYEYIQKNYSQNAAIEILKQDFEF